MANGEQQVDEQVSVSDAIGRSLYAQVARKSTLMAAEIRPHLDEIAEELERDLGAFGYQIVPKQPVL